MNGCDSFRLLDARCCRHLPGVQQFKSQLSLFGSFLDEEKLTGQDGTEIDIKDTQLG